jgi:two-component system sensor histidine kinase KdpD
MVCLVPFETVSGEQGVLRVAGPFQLPREPDDDLLRAVAGEASVALHRWRLAEEASKAQALMRSDEFKSALLAGVSHDLRTPLAAIKAAVGNLRDEAVEWGEQDRGAFFDTIEGQVDRLTKTVERVLELNRLEAGQVQPRIEPIEVELLFEDVRMAVTEPAEDRQLQVAAPGGLWVMADYVLLHQALRNLLDNAFKHSRPAGVVRLSARPSGSSVLLCVSDQGPRIPQQDLERIFEKFYRLPGTTVQGSGLGLAVTRAAVGLCGGRITARAGTDGNEFVLELPAVIARVA